ncbi:MAG: leucine-rich repeat domain-containing protein [Candidatus Hodarchaeota archaeon]
METKIDRYIKVRCVDPAARMFEVLVNGELVGIKEDGKIKSIFQFFGKVMKGIPKHDEILKTEWKQDESVIRDYDDFCLGLKTWSDHGYDIRLLDRDLSYMILKKLARDEVEEAIDVLTADIVYEVKRGGNEAYIHFATSGLARFLSHDQSMEVMAYRAMHMKEPDRSVLLEVQELAKKPIAFHEENVSVKGREPGRVRQLGLDNSGIPKIPESVGTLSRLNQLFAMCNGLERIPGKLFNVKEYYRLMLQNNKLKTLPDTIGTHERIVTFDLRNNDLRTLPDSICNVKKVIWLDLTGNPRLVLTSEQKTWLMSLMKHKNPERERMRRKSIRFDDDLLERKKA